MDTKCVIFLFILFGRDSWPSQTKPRNLRLLHRQQPNDAPKEDPALRGPGGLDR